MRLNPFEKIEIANDLISDELLLLEKMGFISTAYSYPEKVNQFSESSVFVEESENEPEEIVSAPTEPEEVFITESVFEGNEEKPKTKKKER